MKHLYFLIFFLLLADVIFPQSSKSKIFSIPDSKGVSQNIIDDDTTALLYLIKTTGNLNVVGTTQLPTYFIYFIVPITYSGQSPLWLEVECPEMIDYRFMRLDSRNTLVSAQIDNVTDSVCINWTSWVMTRKNKYKDYPMMEPMPDINKLPDSVLPWLMETSTCPYNHPLIQHIADSIDNLSYNLYNYAKRTGRYSSGLGTNYPVEPISFGAYYATNWGSSCTGRAHAAASLLRAKGIPARILMNISSFYPGIQTFHWIVEYYVPDYGWTKMESTSGSVPFSMANREIISFVCSPEDEFPLLFTQNIEAPWYSSDTTWDIYPSWNEHQATKYWWQPENKLLSDTLMSVSQENYNLFTKIQGANITTLQTEDFKTANKYQYKAFEKFKSQTTDSMLYYLNKANKYYSKIIISETHTVFFDDFENGLNGWTSVGVNDEWQLGTPTNYGPDYVYSRNNCWGVNIDSLYNNNANCWLESPSISLDDLATASLDVKIWNDVQDDSIYGQLPIDFLWLEISTDNGSTFSPMSLKLGGVCDFKTGVPKVGGWSRMKFDLTNYVDQDIKIRFHFVSNESISRPGSYIDNFLITGRDRGYDFINENKSSNIVINAFPNPVTEILNVETSNISGNTYLSIINLEGQTLIKQQIEGSNAKINMNHLNRGIYLLKVEDNEGFKTIKIIKN